MSVTLDAVTVNRPWPFVACPNCRHEDFVVTANAAPVVFTCAGCHSAWRYLLGYIQEVAPCRSASGLTESVR